MRFSSIFSASVVAVSFGMYALASPMPLEVSKRQSTSDIESIISTAQTTITPVLAQITALGTGATTAQLAPLVTDITNALDTATASLATLPATAKSKRQADSEIAALVATLITDIATTLDGLVSTGLIEDLLPGLDASLNQLLLGLEILLAGVLNLVAQLLVDVAGLLESLALGLTLATLGL